jgi:hypothetical protein
VSVVGWVPAWVPQKLVVWDECEHASICSAPSPVGACCLPLQPHTDPNLPAVCCGAGSLRKALKRGAFRPSTKWPFQTTYVRRWLHRSAHGRGQLVTNGGPGR